MFSHNQVMQKHTVTNKLNWSMLSKLPRFVIYISGLCKEVKLMCTFVKFLFFPIEKYQWVTVHVRTVT
jgi:hypothetical protein